MVQTGAMTEAPMDPNAAVTQPLDGITVVALEHAVAAPFATRQLADLGARVIKIERPGEGLASPAPTTHPRCWVSPPYFVWLNRGKGEPDPGSQAWAGGREVLSALLAGADVLIQNLAPGATAPRWGWGSRPCTPPIPD